MSANIPIEFTEFELQSLAEGYDNVFIRQWKADEVVPSHTHPFSLKAVVVEGEMWLTVGDDTHHLIPGAEFKLEHEALHSERYGPDGATYWVASKSG